eukprot:3495138-Rhodomonas_salina.3
MEFQVEAPYVSGPGAQCTGSGLHLRDPVEQTSKTPGAPWRVVRNAAFECESAGDGRPSKLQFSKRDEHM